MDQETAQGEKLIDLFEILGIIKKSFVWMIIVAILFAGATYCGVKAFVPPTYEASATMVANSKQEQVTNVTYEQMSASQQLVNLYGVIATSRTVLQPVIDELDLPFTYTTLKKNVAITEENDTLIMRITVTDTDYERALKTVASIVKRLPEAIQDSYEGGSVKKLDNPYTTGKPVGPHVWRYTILAAVVGALLVFIIGLLTFLLDNTYKSEMDLQQDLKVPVIGLIPDLSTLAKNASKKGAK